MKNSYDVLPAHVNQGHLNLGNLAKDLASSDEEVGDSDIDFQPSKQMKKRKNKQKTLSQKRQAKVVPTPGSYKLVQSAIDSSDDDDMVQCQEINSIEKLDTVEVVETDDKIFINFNDENAAKAQDVASKLRSGQAKVGLVDGEQIIMNVSPVTKARLVKDIGKNNTTAAKPSGSKSLVDKPLKENNNLKNVKKFTGPSAVKKGEQVEKPEFQKVFKSYQKEKPVAQKVTKPKIKLASYLEDLDKIYY